MYNEYKIDTIDKSLLKDSTNHYIKNKYYTRFTLDFAQAYYSYDSYYGSQAMAMFLFSDIYPATNFFKCAGFFARI